MKKKVIITLSVAIIALLTFQAYKISALRDFVADILPHSIKYRIKNTLFIVPSLKEQIALKEQELAKANTQLHQALTDTEKVQKQRYFAQLGNNPVITWPYLATLLSQSSLDFSLRAKLSTLTANDKANYQLTQYPLRFLPTALQHGYKPLFYVDSNDKHVFLVTGDGVIMKTAKDFYTKKTTSLTSIPSNIRKVIKNQAIYEPSWFSIKDIKIVGDTLYLSYNKKIDERYTMGILSAKIDAEILNFSEFFTLPDAVSTDGLFNAHQIGGRIELFDDNHLLISAGDMSKWEKAQDEKTLLGKIFTLNIHTKETKIISIGHRNPQGLVFDAQNQLIASTEHGPNGGDEININRLTDSSIKNFGWPMASHGLHYDSRFHEEAPLYKSHKQHGYAEPLKQYTPSVGISQIIKVPQQFSPQMTRHDYFATTMGLNHSVAIQSIHHFRLSNSGQKTVKESIIKVGERIRDIIVLNNTTILLALEGNGTPALAVLKHSN